MVLVLVLFAVLVGGEGGLFDTVGGREKGGESAADSCSCRARVQCHRLTSYSWPPIARHRRATSALPVVGGGGVDGWVGGWVGGCGTR